LELFVLIVSNFTEMTLLDQHVLMNMQKDDRTSNVVAMSVDFVACSFQPRQNY